jgi:protocatechuate 3,4-dioxygenase beta subunit
MLRILLCVAAATAVGAGAAVAASGGSAACRPTAGDVPGPFQRIDAPRRAKIGTGHVLTGRVLRAGDCAAVVHARVVFWQAGPNGYVYRPRGRGSVQTDRAGRFRIEGPVPPSSGLRPPHIHLAVIHPDYEELLTRYVLRRGATSGRMRIVLTPLL